ncbi:hypothetical protein DICPUDRAFT_154195 [Dictyostelium purpureum]|uniref:RNA-binding protein n=1 Tax=Dictyostelium purpureum TaxID=5786 RepID=F0ZQQ1_DICPU|nr:uncharacterized protein DICPUDRAFT_154195 [Dictyostelium purpureum]EGC33747.1 hypothetical protein DICPUDRAFT_154195 [Dictyostelium purpureum]|eukprot:XP_003289746.1 hypothetical protein DICPUDRAFT_154195 [Dictyostelium purpureum]
MDNKINNNNNNIEDDDEGLYVEPVDNNSSNNNSRGRSKEREGRYNKSRSRSRSRSRSKSRSIDRDYSESRSRSYSRSRSRSRERFRKRDYSNISYSNNNNKYNKKWNKQSNRKKDNEPSNILMLKGLTESMNEERLSDFIKIYGAYESIEVRYDRTTGDSKGYAFVNYKTIDEATEILKLTEGSINIDGHGVLLSYGHPGDYDWLCESCNNSNYSWRVACHRCQDPMPENPRWVSAQQAQQIQESVPSSTIVIRDLVPYATEETLANAFAQFGRTPKRYSVSKKRNICIGFVEYYATNDAVDVFNQCHQRPFYIGDSIVSISYAKNTDNKKEAIDPNIGLSKADMDQWLNNYGSTTVAANIPNGYSYHATTGHYYSSESGYFYDTNNGVYFYYDTNSKGYYCYDSATNSYLPYTPSHPHKQSQQHSNYFNKTTVSQTQSLSSSQAKPSEQQKPDDKRKVVSVPKFNSLLKRKNDSEIEKWKLKASITEKEVADEEKLKNEDILRKKRDQELSQDQEYDPSMPDIIEPISTTTTTTLPVTSDVKPSIGSFSISAPIKLAINKPAAIKVVSPVIVKKTSVFGDLDDEDNGNDNNNSNNNNNNNQRNNNSIEQDPVCTLCMRQFASKEALFKHEKESKLHLENLQKLKSSSNSSTNLYKPSPSNNNNSQSVSPPSDKNKRKQDTTFGENSIGVKLLKKTGWKEGEGLGKYGDGMTSSIQVSMRSERSGLGSEPKVDPRFVIQPGDDYQTRLKKKNFQRFYSENGGKAVDLSNNPFFNG